MSTELSAGARWIDPKGIPMVFVPAGSFLMGSTPVQLDEFLSLALLLNQSASGKPNATHAIYEFETPQHPQTIQKRFWIDLTPTTNAQFQSFIEEDGYQRQELWTKKGWEWNTTSGIFSWMKDRNLPKPRNIDGFLEPNQPRVGMSWYEAVAYARWRDGRLPTEAEWEWAARGPESRIYPWGDIFDPERLVYRENSGEKTAVVGEGIRVAGASWVGALDMVGNVREWCSTVYKEYPYIAADDEKFGIPKYGGGPSSRVSRSAAFTQTQYVCRCSWRIYGDENDRNEGSGFRVVKEADSVL